jgi:hypothetical protein
MTDISKSQLYLDFEKLWEDLNFVSSEISNRTNLKFMHIRFLQIGVIRSLYITTLVVYVPIT